MNRIDAKLRAKKAISGMVLPLWIVTVLLTVPSAFVVSIETIVDTILKANSADTQIVSSLVSVIFSILTVAVTIIMIPAEAGLSAKYLHVARGGKSRERSVWDFYRERNIAEPIKAYLIAAIYVVIGLILFIVPGIIFALRYCLLGFVFADDPGIDYKEALDRCKAITKGRKGELFVFYLSFIGWYFLCILTLGILTIYVIPYENTALAAMYDIYCPKKEPEDRPKSIFDGYEPIFFNDHNDNKMNY